MQITADAIDFKPPRSGRWPMPVGLALVAHALLMAALTWGVHWKQEVEPVQFEAELWSALPREAAPRAVQPPPPPPQPEPKPTPEPTPSPPPQPAVKPPDIATEKAKKQREEDKKRAKETEKRAKEKARKEQAEKEVKARADKKAEEQKKLAEKKKKDEWARQESERRDAALADKLRKDQMARMMGQAGASGGPQARGSAQQDSAPSASYGARVAARVRPNIRSPIDYPSSLVTDVEVRSAPDGTIIGRRVTQSSGNSGWDDQALRAIDRMGAMPKDVDGQVPSPVTIGIRPSD